MADNSPAYIGTYGCGCVVAVTVDAPEYAKDVAEDVAGWIKRGMTVEHVTVGEAKARPHFLPDKCPHHPKGWDPDA